MNMPMLSTEAIAKMSSPQGVEKIAVTDRASWLKHRERDVTASAAAALFGAHEYMTPYQLYALKSGLLAENPEESGPMRRGRMLEPVALKLLAEERPSWRVDVARTYFRDPERRIGATPDAFVIDPERPGFGIAQIKSVEPGVFARKWRADSSMPEAPLWIAVQAIVEATLTGASWAVVTPMVVGFGLDIHVVEIPLHEGIMASLREKVADFWRRVEERDPYPFDYARDGAAIAGLYAADNGSTVDLSAWNEAGEMADEDARLAAEIKARTERRAAIKTEILARMGEAATATIHGRVFATAKTVRRKGYTVAESQYRDVRVKRESKGASA